MGTLWNIVDIPEFIQDNKTSKVANWSRSYFDVIA